MAQVTQGPHGKARSRHGCYTRSTTCLRPSRMSKWDGTETNCGCPQDRGQAADGHCSPVPHRPGVKAAANSARGEGTKSSGCRESEPKASGSCGMEPPLCTASCSLPHGPAPWGLPPQQAGPADTKEESTAQKAPSSKQAGSKKCQSRAGLVGTSNLAIIQGRILGKKEHVLTQKLPREKSCCQ